jgi:hypothetical protein
MDREELKADLLDKIAKAISKEWQAKPGWDLHCAAAALTAIEDAGFVIIPKAPSGGVLIGKSLHHLNDEDARIQIDDLGGNCPVQAHGLIDGEPFYFRARGEHWSLSIGSDDEDPSDIGVYGRDVVGKPRWCHEEKWGFGPFEAGWMPERVARHMIEKGAALFRAANSKTMLEEPGTGDTESAADAEPGLTPQKDLSNG